MQGPPRLGMRGDTALCWEGLIPGTHGLDQSSQSSQGPSRTQNEGGQVSGKGLSQVPREERLDPADQASLSGLSRDCPSSDRIR